jgi:hypothetical protein
MAKLPFMDHIQSALQRKQPAAGSGKPATVGSLFSKGTGPGIMGEGGLRQGYTYEAADRPRPSARPSMMVAQRPAGGGGGFAGGFRNMGAQMFSDKDLKEDIEEYSDEDGDQGAQGDEDIQAISEDIIHAVSSKDPAALADAISALYMHWQQSMK